MYCGEFKTIPKQHQFDHYICISLWVADFVVRNFHTWMSGGIRQQVPKFQESDQTRSEGDGGHKSTYRMHIELCYIKAKFYSIGNTVIIRIHHT
jgi:hypothetical protein